MHFIDRQYFQIVGSYVTTDQFHYENMPIQIYRKFHLQKTDNFQMQTLLIFFIFLLKTQIVVTRQNRLGEAVLTRTHYLSFWAEIRKK